MVMEAYSGSKPSGRAESKKNIVATSGGSANPPTVTLPQKLFVGASAGVFGTSLIYPLDVLKTQIQSSSQRLTFRSLSNMMTSVGSGGLYRGFSACLIGIAPEKALKLTVNDFMRDFFTMGGGKSIQVHQEMIAGSMAGLIQLIVTVPYESVKIRLQMRGANTAMEAVRAMGAKGLYRGLTATFYRDVPFCLVFFPLYAQLKSQQMSRFYANQSEPFHVGLVAGIGAGAISAAMVTPADMLKTRIQQGLNGNMGFFAFAQDVARKEGTAALFKGWQARVLVIAPLYGIVSLAFELQKRILLDSASPSV